MLLGVQRLPPGGDAVGPADDGPELPGLHLQGAALGVPQVPAVAYILFQQYGAVLVQKGQFAALRHPAAQLAVDDGGPLVVQGDLCLGGGGQQRPVPGGHGGFPGGAHPQAAGAPGFHPEGLGVKVVAQTVLLLGDHQVPSLVKYRAALLMGAAGCQVRVVPCTASVAPHTS